MANIKEILEARQTTHGTFSESANTVQRIKFFMHRAPNWDSLSNTQREGLEMIVHKIGRMLHGDPKLVDTVSDIIGYATLIKNDMSTTNGATDVASTRMVLNDGEWVKL